MFRDRRCAHASPGQYVMLWLPGVDEVPMSLSSIGPGVLCGVSVERVGEATTVIHQLKEGDLVGVRGPFGKGFTPSKGKVLLVAGGTGLASLLPLAERFKALGGNVLMACGGKTRSVLFGLERLRSLVGSESLVLATEDGSVGVKGLVTEVAARILDESGFEAVYTCGPEPMMRVVFELAERRGVPTQACLERMVKCSLGLCGSCMIGRFRLCKDGPVLSSVQLREVLDEFGVFTRGFDGSPIWY